MLALCVLARGNFDPVEWHGATEQIAIASPNYRYATSIIRTGIGGRRPFKLLCENRQR
jgi:hypothetical protein